MMRTNVVEHEEDYKELLSVAARSQVAILHEFRINYYNNDESIHVFFEGEDDRMYFMPEIRNRCRATTHSYDCGGKPRLKQIRNDAYDIIDDRSRCLFFVDRDHDDYIGDQILTDLQTYITDFYSVESDLATEEAADILAIDIAGITRSQPEFSSLIRNLALSRDSFYKALLPITAWTIEGRKNRQKINLSNVDLALVVTRDATGLFRRKRGGFSYFRKQVGAATYKPSCKAFRKTIRDISAQDERLWMRGKYALWFFVTEMSIQLRAILGIRSGHGRKIKLPQSLAHNAAFEMLSARVSKPISLINFLDTVLPK